LIFVILIVGIVCNVFIYKCAFSVSKNLVPAIYGLMGLGSMSISIPNQMAKKGLIQHMVRFCFQYGVYQIDYDGLHANLNPIGYFILGQPPDYDKEYQWIPMGAKPPENGCVYKISLKVYCHTCRNYHNDKNGI